MEELEKQAEQEVMEDLEGITDEQADQMFDEMAEAAARNAFEMDQLICENEQLVAEIERLRLDLQTAQAATAQFKNSASELGKLVKREQEGRKADRKAYEAQISAIRKYVSKPLALPVILGISAGILALLVGVCIDRGLMTCVLGDPLGAGLLATCALFAGVVYERLRLR